VSPWAKLPPSLCSCALSCVCQCTLKPKFHDADFPETSPVSGKSARGSFGEVGVMESALKGASRVCRGRHGEVGTVEFGLNEALVYASVLIPDKDLATVFKSYLHTMFPGSVSVRTKIHLADICTFGGPSSIGAPRPNFGVGQQAAFKLSEKLGPTYMASSSSSKSVGKCTGVKVSPIFFASGPISNKPGNFSLRYRVDRQSNPTPAGT